MKEIFFSPASKHFKTICKALYDHDRYNSACIFKLQPSNCSFLQAQNPTSSLMMKSLLAYLMMQQGKDCIGKRVCESACVFSFLSIDGHLPSIENPNKSSETASKPPAMDFTLPPVHFNPSSVGHFTQHSLTANKPSTEPDHKSFPEPIKKSDLAQILEAAKKIRDEKIAATAGVDRLNRAKKSPRKVAVSRVANFNSPRTSMTNYKSRYVTQQTVGFQSEPNSSRVPADQKMLSGGATEIIDLESSDAATVDSYNPQLKSVSLVSLHGRKSRSQAHLTTSPSKSRLPKSQRLRRSRSHARIGSQHITKQDAKRINHSKSVSLEDMPAILRASSPVVKREQRVAMFEQRGIAAATTTTSKPIVKKPSFIKPTVPKLNIKQADSVYGARPYVIPMAKRVVQQGSSPQRHGIANTKKKASRKSYSHLKRKHQRQRQELTMPKGKLTVLSDLVKRDLAFKEI